VAVPRGAPFAAYLIARADHFDRRHPRRCGAIANAMSVLGPTRTKGDDRFRAAVRGIADIERALIGSVPI
jgi:hypothetical protein